MTAITEYSDALVIAKDGTKQDTAIKNAKRAILEGMISENGNYVNLIANEFVSYPIFHALSLLRKQESSVF